METSHFGKLVDAATQEMLFNNLAISLKIKGSVTKFIGSHPSSLSKNNIDVILNEDYLVCEKSDGIRAMLFIYNKILYFYDRKNVFYRTRYVIDVPHCYLFDGEIYKEDDFFVFAIFDTLISDSENQTAGNLLQRLEKAHAFTKALGKTPGMIQVSNDSTYHKFKIITKSMTKSYGFHQVLDTIPKLAHENDGLIFTPVRDCYMVDAQTRTFKWKPPHLNTVDFYIKKSLLPYTYDLCGVIVINQLPRKLRNKLPNKKNEQELLKFSFFYSPVELSEIDGQIGEFRYDPDKEVVDMEEYTISKGGWSLYKIRTDKFTPNNIKVILGVLDSINENVDEPALRLYWKAMADNYKKRQEINN